MTRNSTAYASQLAPITGVLLADYYVVHRQTYDVEEMYIPGGKYQYNKYGTNWRAVTAWLAGCLPLVGGFAAAVSPPHLRLDASTNEIPDEQLPLSAFGCYSLVQIGISVWILLKFRAVLGLEYGFPA